MVERDNTIYAIAVKSGTSVFNADSRKKQEQNFMAASKLAQQAKKRFVPIVGYGYGKKKCPIVDCQNSIWNWRAKISGQN